MGLRPLRMKVRWGCPPRVWSPLPHRTQSWRPCLPGQPRASGWRSTDHPVPSPRGWMIGFSERDAAHNRALLRCLSSRRCIRSWRSRGWPLSRPEAARLSPPSSLPSTAGLPGGTRAFPRWRERSRCTCARETPPLGGIVRVSRPKPVSWRLLSQPKLIVLRARQPLPCMPWRSCRFTKPRHSNKCTRVVPTRGWCRSCARRLTSLYERRKSRRGPSGRRCPLWWSRSTISGSTWQRWRMSTKHAFSTPPSPRLGCSATLSRALPSSSRQCRSRPRRSSTSCHGGMLRQRRLPLGPGLRLLVAVDALLRPPELLRPVLKRLLGRRVEPLAGARHPPHPIRAPSRPGSRRSGPDAGNPEMLEFALSQETTRTASLLPPVEGRVENLMFPFISVPPLAQGSAAPTYSKKEQFPFPPGFQVHGSTVCDALPPHSRPRPILPAAKRVRFGDAVPPHAPLASPLWDPGSSAWMPQNALPSVPSSSTPLRCTTAGTSIVPLEPLARRLEAWLALPSPSRWLTRTIRLGYAIQFARRPPKFSGVLETSVAARNAPVLREEIAVLLAKDAIEPVPPAEMRQGFLQPLLHRTQERRWSSTNPGFATPEPGPAQVDAQAYDQMHTAPGLVCSDRPEGCLLSCFDPSPTQTVPTVCVRRSGVAVQGPPLRALPLSPCLHEGRRGRPCPVTGSGRQDPQLSRRLAHSGPVPRTVVRSQGSGASAPQPVGASGQLGKEQALPCAENLFSWCGVRLGEYDGAPHGRARPISAELPEFLQRQDCGSTETVSEAPGAYGIRSCGHAARIASYETTSLLVALPSPEVGMAPRCTSGEHHTGVSPLLQPLDRPCLSTGRGALRTSVSACCCHNRCLQHGLGRYMQRAGSLGALDRASTALAHQLPRAAGSASSLAAVSATAVRQACVGLYGQHCGCVVHQPDGGIRSRRMSQLARHLLLWSHTRLKSLRAVHIPGELNRVADALSRQLTFPGEWRLHPETIRLIWSRFGEAQVDLFASRESSHCQLYFSLTEGTLGTDALAHSWPRALCKYAFPPVSLLAQTLCKVREDEEQVLLVAPFWPTRTWLPELILLATAPPWRIPLRKDLLSQGLGTIWHPRPDLWNLHVWLLDGTRQTWVVSHRRW